jgi:TRAP-type mannitol/chloroaromatic compound transport system permease small subunit
MPELTFVLPHWLYWAGLVVFPIAAMILFRRPKPDTPKPPVSLPLGYFLLLTGGFIGVHRLYIKSFWAGMFVALFTAILFVNIEVRTARDALSGADNDIKLAELKIERAEKAREKQLDDAQQQIEDAARRMEEAVAAQQAAQANSDTWNTTSSTLALTVLLLLIVDAILLPRLVRRRNEIEAAKPTDSGFHCPTVEREHDDSAEPYRFNKISSHINGLAGELVAYWSVIAVFAYYYEVMARYVFNSPTNWAHESMFLMFGMQYLIAGGFVLREGGHVRVDVLYNKLSRRAKAICDLITSLFFFIFVATLLVTGWTFFKDAYAVSEVSFTEWEIAYWPIKFALPLGAALLLLQGLSQLIKDIIVAINPDTTDLDTATRPEG